MHDRWKHLLNSKRGFERFFEWTFRKINCFVLSVSPRRQQKTSRWSSLGRLIVMVEKLKIWMNWNTMIAHKYSRRVHPLSKPKSSLFFALLDQIFVWKFITCIKYRIYSCVETTLHACTIQQPPFDVTERFFFAFHHPTLCMWFWWITFE